MRPPTPRDDLRFSNTTGILQKKKHTMWLIIVVEVEQETSASPPKKNPASAPELAAQRKLYAFSFISDTFRLLLGLLQGMNTTDKEQHI